MRAKKFFELAHRLFIFIVVATFILIPSKYIKYIAWIPLAICISWIIFNGCILDTLHNDNANVGTAQTDNITPILEFFRKPLACYIRENYLLNTNRRVYITATLFILLATIACYRVIFNIDINLFQVISDLKGKKHFSESSLNTENSMNNY